ncbi:PH domain-containing protein [Kitasatospora sp. NPDC096204]|uniref:PH domain-containing protein n=1 Tax=Kitasatospora sp. NPDC096204 TaxID=3364094 RepID=UPI0038078923
MRQWGSNIGIGCAVAVATMFALGGSGATGAGTATFIGVLIGGAAAAGVPHTFRLREDEDGLTLVRLLATRRYAWSEISGLAMEFGEEVETSGHHVTLRLRLVDPPGRFWGPQLGRIDVTEDDRPRGVEPRALAELFAVFGRHGVPVDQPEFANAVLHVYGLPPLPPQPVRQVPAGPVPTAAEAYADAPDVAQEEKDLAARRSTVKSPPRKRREHLLRAAARADRIALAGDDGDPHEVVRARIAAGELTEHDRVTADGDGARRYVRQQYLDWRRTTAEPRRGRRTAR